MNASKNKALKAKMDKEFDSNPFAKKYKETNEARHTTRAVNSMVKNIHPALRREPSEKGGASAFRSKDKKQAAKRFRDG